MPRVAPVTSATLPLKSSMAADTSTSAPSTPPPVSTPATPRLTGMGSLVQPGPTYQGRQQMDSYITMQGNIVAGPVQPAGGARRRVPKYRLASSGRNFDKGVQDWVDTSTVYKNVSGWRQLGDNVFTTLHKGDTVL